MRLYDMSELKIVVEAQDTMLVDMQDKYKNIDFKDFLIKFINSDFKRCLDVGDPAYFGLFGLGLLNRFMAYETNITLADTTNPSISLDEARRALCSVTCLSREKGKFSKDILNEYGLEKLVEITKGKTSSEFVQDTLNNINTEDFIIGGLPRVETKRLNAKRRTKVNIDEIVSVAGGKLVSLKNDKKTAEA